MLSLFGQTGPSRSEWTHMNADPSESNSVEQKQVTEQTIGSLALKWMYPFPAVDNVPGLNVTGQGAIAPPLVVNGTVYVITDFLRVYAMDAASGSILWTYDAQLNTTGLPLGPLTGHMHGLSYYEGRIWVGMPDCSAVALDAVTGRVVQDVRAICAGIPGNAGLYDSSGVPPTFYKDTMIWSSSVSEGTDGGRGFVAAYDISNNSGRLLWRWYVTPQAGGDPSWDTVSCPPATCQGNVKPVNGDWGTMGYGGKTMAGAGPSFGQPVVDTRLGLVYVSTSQAAPDWNGTYRPGPDLYSDSVVALNVTNGHMDWFFQTTPHDLFDFDCGWNTALGNVTLAGVGTHEAVFKACKNGYVYALDALTGKKIWYFDPPSLKRTGTSNADYVVTGNYSADQRWINYPSTGQFKQCPGSNGGVESDISVAYGKVFVATHNFCTYGQVASVSTAGGAVWGVKYLQPISQEANTTIYAIDASTGKESWSFFIPSVPYRGWLTASGGMVFASSLDGNIYALDATTGKVVHTQYMGPSLYQGVTVGSTSSGDVYLFQLVSSPAYGLFAERIPGALMVFGVEPVGPGSVDLAIVLVAALVAAALVAAVAEEKRPAQS